MDSILQKEKVCMVCRTTRNLESHHIYGGPRRRASERLGLKIWLCHEHHTGNQGVHFNKDFMDELHEYAQMVFESIYGEEEFLKEFGKNYKRGEAVNE